MPVRCPIYATFTRVLTLAVVGLSAASAQAQSTEEVPPPADPAAVSTPNAAPLPEAGPILAPPVRTKDNIDETVDLPRGSRPFRGWSLTPGVTVPLGLSSAGGSAEGTRNASGPVATLTIRYTPKEGWFALTTLSAYLKPSQRKPWNGDFVYAFGYDNWRPNTASLTYTNYGNNRFDPRPRDGVTNFLRGAVNLGYKINLSGKLAEPFLIDREQKIGCRGDTHYSARYERASGRDGSHKIWTTVGCRYPIWRRAYADLSLHQYLRGEQRPWDPDYTYGFGWFDWRPGHISVQYSNYSGMRYPWRKQQSGTGKFSNGTISATWSHAF
jgi:hypothetical protein